MVQNLYLETWLPITGYEGLYEVSNIGRVKALKKQWYSGDGNRILRSKEEILIKQSTSKGYNHIILTKNGVQRTFRVHRLVCINFIPNTYNKPCVNHKNGIKNDNRLENLEWCTVSENGLHSYKTGLQKRNQLGNHNRAKKISCTTLGIDFGCAKEAAQLLGLDKTTVQRVALNERIHTQGFTFRYI